MYVMLNLEKLSDKLDDALSKETEASLKDWMNKKRTLIKKIQKEGLTHPELEHLLNFLVEEDARLASLLFPNNHQPQCKGCGAEGTRIVNGYCEWCAAGGYLK